MKKYFWDILILFSVFIDAFSQTDLNFKVEKYDSENGLSQNSVFCIHQDKKGFLYFGTENGLNKFDGNHFANFFFEYSDSASGSKNVNWIYDIAEDNNNNLWLATRYGVAIFNIRNNQTKHIFIDTLAEKGISFYSILFDGDSLMYLSSTTKYIIIINVNNFSKKFLSIPQEYTKHNEFAIYDLTYNKKNKELYLAANAANIIIYQIKQNKFNEIKLASGVNYEVIRAIELDTLRNFLWIGSYRKGLLCYDLIDKKFIELKNLIFDKISIDILSKLPIRSLKVHYDKLYVGSLDKGFFVLDITKKKFISINETHNPININKIGNRINEIFVDWTNNIWLGEYASGLSKLTPNPFNLVGAKPNDKLALQKKSVWRIFENSNGDILIASEKGIFIYDKNHNLKKILDNENSYKEYSVSSAYDIVKYNKDETIWLILNYGIVKLDKNYNFLGYYDIYNNKLPEPYPSHALITSDNQFYVIGDSYFCYYNEKDDKFYNFFENDTVKFIDVNCISEDSQKRIWIGTSYNGFSIINPLDKTIKNYSSSNKSSGLQTNEVFYIYEESKGVYWIASSNGLHKFIEKENRFINKEKETGYIDELIYCIIPDNDNNLWLSSNNGLIRFNLTTKTKIRFVKSDGLSFNEFNTNAAIKLKDGKIIFGGTAGAIIFDPSKVTINNFHPPVYITKIEIDGEIYKPNINYEYLDEVTLHPKNKIISIEFAALDFTNPYKIEYKYNLQGFEQPWKSSNKRIAIFTNLEPKTYYFKLLATNHYGIWGEETILLKINQLPPFYKTFWFRAIIIISVAILFAIILKIRENFYEKKNRKLQKINELLNIEISERKQLEQKLIESESRLRTIFENLKSLIFIIKDDKIVFQNTCCKSTLKYEDDDLKNIEISQILQLNQELKELLKLISEEKIESIKFETKALTKDKREIWLEIFSSTLKDIYISDNDVKQIYILCSAIDISERKEIEKNLRKAKELAEKSNMLKLNFLAQISHEIRTPLNSIISFSELLNSDLKEYLSDEYKMALESIAKSSKRIYRTVDLILNTSEIQIGSYEINPTKFKFYPDIIEYAAQEIIEDAKSKNLYFTIKSKYDLIWIKADFHSTFNIFYHLFDNAVKYTEKGGVTVIIDKISDKKAKVSVIDTGVGISESYIQKLFTPFSQEQEGYTRKFDGVGLGLSLVKSYCDFNDFEISITSQKGRGTTIEIIITNIIDAIDMVDFHISDLIHNNKQSN